MEFNAFQSGIQKDGCIVSYKNILILTNSVISVHFNA